MLAFLPDSLLCQDLFSEWEVRRLYWRIKFTFHQFPVSYFNICDIQINLMQIKLNCCSKKIIGIPVMAQWKQIRLASMRTQVRSLASLSGLRMQHCYERWCNSQMMLRSGIAVAVVQASSHSSDSTPSLETSISHGWGPKKTPPPQKKSSQ